MSGKYNMRNDPAGVQEISDLRDEVQSLKRERDDLKRQRSEVLQGWQKTELGLREQLRVALEAPTAPHDELCCYRGALAMLLIAFVAVMAVLFVLGWEAKSEMVQITLAGLGIFGLFGFFATAIWMDDIPCPDCGGNAAALKEIK